MPTCVLVPRTSHLLPSALFDDGGVALNDDGIDGLLVMVMRRSSTLPGALERFSMPSSS